jgi:rod shape-determining protein MreB and related proteins
LSLGSAAVIPHAGLGDLAIDLGTANTRVYIPGEGVVLDEPSVIAMDVRDKKVLAVGRPAKAMTGRAPDSIHIILPVRRGVVANVGAAREMLDHFMRAVAGRWRVRRPRVAVVVPYGTTQVEKGAVRKLGGSRRYRLLTTPLREGGKVPNGCLTRLCRAPRMPCT